MRSLAGFKATALLAPTTTTPRHTIQYPVGASRLGISIPAIHVYDTDLRAADFDADPIPQGPTMAQRMQQGGRPGGARFAQFKLVLLGE